MAANRRLFQIEHCLGRGGFGEVYKARMTQPGGLTTSVALKVLLPDAAAGAQPIERLRDEGRMLAALEHPVILRAVDVTVLANRVTLVAEFVAGQDLDGCTTGDGPLGARGVVQVVGEVASALASAWSTPAANGEPLRLVHRDIKPSNIRIGRHGEVKLLDFGIARTDAMDRDAKTATFMVVGSLPYMAPERFSDRPIGPEADVYGLGCCLYQGIVGRVPFPRLSPPQVLRLALEADHFEEKLERALGALPDGLDPRIRALIVDCMAHEPERRPTASELAERCEALAQDLPGPTLKQWARARDWPDTAHESGPLDGLEVTETLVDALAVEPAADRIESAPTMERRAAPKWPWVLAAVGIAALALAGGLGGVAAGLGFAWSRGPGERVEAPASAPETPERAPDAPQGEADEEVPEPAPAPPVEVTEPGAPAEEVPDAPEDDPAAGAPDAAPEVPVDEVPAPRAPPAARTGTLVVVGATPVELRGAPGRFGPGEVPAGDFEIFADFGEGHQLAGTARVRAGEVVKVQCNALLASCEEAR